MIDDLLIDMTLVKVKIFPEFKRTRPSMSRRFLEVQIDFPAIGLAPKARRNLLKMPRPLSLETGVLVDNSTENR